MTKHEHWSEEPEEHDYPAAADYLSLVCDDASTEAIVTALRAAPVVRRKAKDLLRASGLGLLGAEVPEVANDLRKVRHGAMLSPVLLVRGTLKTGRPLTVADGYHRICASYHLDENAEIHCKIAPPHDVP